MKIIDKINQKLKEGQTFFSFEFFPPRTEEGVENLFERLDRMVTHAPIFCDITWGAGGSTADVTLDIATRMQNQVCVETMMHLTCTNMQVEKLESALKEVKKVGVQNILALRGDPPKGQEKFEAIEGGFSCALDLVKYIRKEFGVYFGICVAGYPEAHPDGIVDDPDQMNKNYWADIAYLKQKVDAGGELIITQLFYDVDLFVKFVADCRSVGITVPILPGIMPIMTYGGFKRMVGFCKTKVPADIMETVEANKDNDEAIKNFGIELGVKMCRQLLEAGTPGVHMYTLNLEKSAVAILERLGLVDTARVPKPLPWRHVPSGTARACESVRPVFWTHRPKAYLKRTQGWPSYPTGRWADRGDLQYGSLADAPQFMRRHTATDARKDKARAAWGAALEGEEDVKAVFAKYVKGEVKSFPWSELEGAHQPEGAPETAQLLDLIAAGLLVINSQPRLNGVSSTDPTHGWGAPGGSLYGRAYLEFFCSPAAWESLRPRLDAAPSVSYLAASASGSPQGNLKPDDVVALSWGAFPGKEIVQPTVLCASSFGVWKDEAFELWLSEWSSLYEEGSPSRQLLADIHDRWLLVAVVDNDFVAGDLAKTLLG